VVFGFLIIDIVGLIIAYFSGSHQGFWQEEQI
jgi:hypothetical protein